jgi:uncharacterized membrane protein HdeD (DUF308 family)
MAGEHTAETPNRVIATPAVRKALYGVAAAVGGVLLIYGIVTQDQLNAWLQLAASVITLGSGALAFVNTPRKPTCPAPSGSWSAWSC